MKPPAPLEIAIQSGFKNSLRYIAPRVRMIAVPNAAKRGLAAQRQAKREGLATGFPDCICMWGGGYCFIEFKRPGGVLTDNQREWIEWLNENGHRTAVCWSIEDAQDFLRGCGAPVIGRVAA